MVKDFVDFVENVCKNWSGDRTAALIVGLCFGVLAVVVLGRYLRFFVSPWAYRHHEKERLRLEADNQRLREECKETGGKHDTLWKMHEGNEGERQQLRDRVHQLSEECERLKDDSVRLSEDRDRIKGLGKKLMLLYQERGAQIKSLNAQVQHIMDLEGSFWEKAPLVNAPQFRPLDDRAAPIVAVMNLKGGVGKTTLTANLGGTLWGKGLRVLLVDLDHQGTLTSLCLSLEQERDVNRGEGKLVNNVIKAKERLDEIAWQNLVPLEGGSCLLPANKFLANVEEDLKARWLLQRTERDSRFLLREALHSRLLQDRFDVILIDCPPRITTCCINALACADHVLMPVLIDKPSTDAVPNLLGWLRSLKEKGICPQLSLLGIVGNRSHWKTRLTKREKTLWNELQKLSEEAWGQPVYSFKRSIPNKPLFASAAETRKLAAFEKDLSPVFGELLKELLSRKVIHENRKSAGIPS